MRTWQSQARTHSALSASKLGAHYQTNDTTMTEDKKPMTVAEFAAKGGAARWAGKSAEERSAHGKAIRAVRTKKQQEKKGGQILLKTPRETKSEKNEE